ncbi:early nodulin-like protein 2 [Setaria italica]|uniref:early nodulin-like protein 2 n=1 Tax=Setaria italica TaxID=4555 RepID=UPI000646743F|nr:early nodulin-like protein 2 [Setaria italica]
MGRCTSWKKQLCFCCEPLASPVTSMHAFVAASAAAASHGDVFYVGDKDGWVGKPAESYGRWAARHQFKVTDTLVFRYKKGVDSVLVVDKRHYDTCDVKDPVDELRDGDSATNISIVVSEATTSHTFTFTIAN